MDGVTVPLTTPYGPLEVRILAGPTLAPGAHVTGHTFEDRDNGYRPVDVPAHVYAVAETSGYGQGPELAIHGVAYRGRGRFELTADGWQVARENASGWNVLRRDGVYPSDPTSAACKAWQEVIVPAVLACLADASAEVGQAEATARAEYVAAIGVEVARLRAEADRLEGLAR